LADVILTDVILADVVLADNIKKTLGGLEMNVHGSDGWANKKTVFVPGEKDGIFAVVMVIAGYYFTRHVLFSWMGWGITGFTVVILGVTLCYALLSAKQTGQRVSPQSWCWFAVTLLTGISYTLYEAPGINLYRSLFLICSFVYYVLHLRRNVLIEGKTSNYLFFDAVNGMWVIPFANYGLWFIQLKGLKSLGSKSQGSKSVESKSVEDDEISSRWRSSKSLGIVVGILLLIPLFALLIPLLSRADWGYFSYFMGGITTGIETFIRSIHLGINIFYFVLAIPVILYLCGLIGGTVNHLHCESIAKKQLQTIGDHVAVIPAATVNTGYIGVILLYGFFIAVQIPYFFNVFLYGKLPASFSTVSQYARQGFFELLVIALINLALIYLGRQFCRKGNQTYLKVFHIILSVITLLLILSAFSKFGLYVKHYGLTMRRILPCLFLVFLALVFLGILVSQFVSFSILRFALICGTAIMLFLSFGNLDGCAASYNANRYLSHTLPEFDVDAARLNGCAALPAIEKVLSEDPQTQNKDNLEEVRTILIQDRDAGRGTLLQTWK
jgi:hypothetical protein